MADPARRLAANAGGALFVDSSCIDCEVCRQLAPATFVGRGSFSAVARQPSSPEETEAALRALVACPVGAIGDLEHRPIAGAAAAFPLAIDGPVSALGFTARASYGATAYLLEHPDGNWMIDGPRWNAGLAERIAERGGLRYVFLTHRDDVADAARYAARFGAERIIHRRDRAAVPDAEIVIDGDEPIAFGDVRLIPTPGHTRGHTVLLHRGYLFTGDHLAWDPKRATLTAYRDVCWYDWPTQLRSLARLADEEIRWVLPGHGERVRLEPAAVSAALRELVARAERSGTM
jgi:glyoxylase-like metal-dependent hydrolase (beta-lactamase superfamily II)/ferredoxin